MKKNIGTADRLFRLLIGIALAVYGWWQASVPALLLSAFVFFEAFSSWCAFYHLIGKSTCPLPKSAKDEHPSMSVHAHSLGLAGGIFFGVYFFFWTIVALYTGWGIEWLSHWSSLYPGYSISWEGGVMGLINGGVTAFFIFFILAKLYNTYPR
jgi:hypothetical protein